MATSDLDSRDFQSHPLRATRCVNHGAGGQAPDSQEVNNLHQWCAPVEPDRLRAMFGLEIGLHQGESVCNTGSDRALRHYAAKASLFMLTDAALLRYEALDGLRGVAALTVMFGHFGLLLGLFSSPTGSWRSTRFHHERERRMADAPYSEKKTKKARKSLTTISIVEKKPSLEISRTFITLDGLRGVAALAVATRHAPFLWQAGHPTGFLYESYLSVDFFFVLSGFVLAYAYDERFRTGMSARQFMSARLIRLYPLYLFAFLISNFTRIRIASG